MDSASRSRSGSDASEKTPSEASGGGGATSLAGLSDVPSGPSTQNDVAVVNNSNQMVYQKLTIDNFNPAAIQVASESYGDNDTTLMTSAAIQDHVQSLMTTTTTDCPTDVRTSVCIPFPLHIFAFIFIFGFTF